MSNEKMRVLDLLEAGKIDAKEAAELIAALNAPKFINKETRENVEEKLQQFAKDCTNFAKDAGSKMHDFYKDIEPKVKKASQTALEKAAEALDSLAKTINESINKDDCGDCGDDTPKEN